MLLKNIYITRPLDYQGNWINNPKYIDFAYTLPSDFVPIINTSGETDPRSPWDCDFRPQFSPGYVPSLDETIGLREWQERLERGESAQAYTRREPVQLCYDSYEQYKIDQLAIFTEQQKEDSFIVLAIRILIRLSWH